jgi:hypothetical protein
LFRRFPDRAEACEGVERAQSMHWRITRFGGVQNFHLNCQNFTRLELTAEAYLISRSLEYYFRSHRAIRTDLPGFLLSGGPHRIRQSLASGRVYARNIRAA